MEWSWSNLGLEGIYAKCPDSNPGVTNLFETESYFLGTDFAKGYQFDTHFWNSQFAQFTFNYMLLLIINDIHLRQGSPTRCPQVVKCLSTLCHFAVATVAPQMRHTQAPFTVVKKNSTSHSSWKWYVFFLFSAIFLGVSHVLIFAVPARLFTPVCMISTNATFWSCAQYWPLNYTRWDSPSIF